MGSPDSEVGGDKIHGDNSICRLTKSDFQEPLNIGSDETVNMNEMVKKFEKNFE